MPILPFDDCILSPQEESENSYYYPAEKLKDRIKQISYIDVAKNTNTALQGIHFLDQLMVTCDGIRLAINTDTNLNIKTPFTVGVESLKTLCEIASGGMMIRTHKNYMSAETKDMVFFSRLIEGKFLDVHRVMPSTSSTVVHVETKQYLEALKYLKEFIDKDRPMVKWGNNFIQTSGVKGNFECSIEQDNKMDFEILYNINYMIDALGQFAKDKSITISLNGALSPLLISNENDCALVCSMKAKK